MDNAWILHKTSLKKKLNALNSHMKVKITHLKSDCMIISHCYVKTIYFFKFFCSNDSLKKKQNIAHTHKVTSSTL